MNSMQRDDLIKADLLSEVVLLVSGVAMSVVMILLLAAALTAH
jgi:hypothetical protein